MKVPLEPFKPVGVHVLLTTFLKISKTGSPNKFSYMLYTVCSCIHIDSVQAVVPN